MTSQHETSRLRIAADKAVAPQAISSEERYAPCIVLRFVSRIDIVMALFVSQETRVRPRSWLRRKYVRSALAPVMGPCPRAAIPRATTVTQDANHARSTNALGDFIARRTQLICHFADGLHSCNDNSGWRCKSWHNAPTLGNTLSSPERTSYARLTMFVDEFVSLISSPQF